MYKFGQKIWLRVKNIIIELPSRKPDWQKYHPYCIIEKIRKVAYRLDLPASLQIHNVFHVSPFRDHKPRVGEESTCIPGNFRSDACTMHCLPTTVSVTVGREYYALFTCHRGNFGSDAYTMHCLPATVSVTFVECCLCMKPRKYSFFPLGF